jgi:predicted GNAT superfamily acetyltransferase
MESVVIRPAVTDDDYAQCERISRFIWGSDERNNVPRELLKTIQVNGGVVIGAFDNARLVGFVFGFAGLRDGKLRLCSHQLGVLREYQGRGVGIALKEAQRERALELGYDLITWTFDPLEARNAYLNLHRLGAIAAAYHRNHYGEMGDELNRGLPSDRFEVEWHIKGKTQKAGSPLDFPLLLMSNAQEEPQRAQGLDLARLALVGIAVPPNFQALKKRDLALALRWRLESRQAFEQALRAGFAGIDFQRDQSRYLLARS